RGPEEEAIEPFRKDVDEREARAGPGLGGKARSGIGERLRLGGDRLRHAGVPMAQVGRDELTGEVEVFLPGRVPESRTFGPGHHERVPSSLPPPRDVVRLPDHLPDLVAVHRTVPWVMGTTRQVVKTSPFRLMTNPSETGLPQGGRRACGRSPPGLRRGPVEGGRGS